MAVTIRVSESLGERKEQIPMEELERLCSNKNIDKNIDKSEDESASRLIKADSIILNYLYLIYSDMNIEGIKDMYYAAKNFVSERSELTGVELAKATSLTMIELLDYTRDLINMNNEMEEE